MSDIRATGNNSLKVNIVTIDMNQCILFMQERTKWSFRSAPSLQGWKRKLFVENVYDTVAWTATEASKNGYLNIYTLSGSQTLLEKAFFGYTNICV